MGEEADALSDQTDETDVIRCERCGAEGLVWEKTHRGWRLYDEAGHIHTCQRKGV